MNPPNSSKVYTVSLSVGKSCGHIAALRRCVCADSGNLWVSQVSVLPDEVDAISAELRMLSEAHDVVITSGGLGPTIDDVTMQGVADALGHQLTRCRPDARHTFAQRHTSMLGTSIISDAGCHKLSLSGIHTC